MKATLLVLLAAVLIFNTVSCGKGTPPGYHLYALFTRPQNLQPGDPVIMAGVQIGYVDSIALDPSSAETHVTMHIQRSVVVKTDSTATLNSAASPGRSSIVLDGGSPSAKAMVDGGFLPTREKPSSENQTHPRDRLPNTGRANRRPAFPLNAERQFERRSFAPPFWSAVVSLTRGHGCSAQSAAAEFF